MEGYETKIYYQRIYVSFDNGLELASQLQLSTASVERLKAAKTYGNLEKTAASVERLKAAKKHSNVEWDIEITVEEDEVTEPKLSVIVNILPSKSLINATNLIAVRGWPRKKVPQLLKHCGVSDKIHFRGFMMQGTYVGYAIGERLCRAMASSEDRIAQINDATKKGGLGPVLRMQNEPILDFHNTVELFRAGTQVESARGEAGEEEKLEQGLDLNRDDEIGSGPKTASKSFLDGGTELRKFVNIDYDYESELVSKSDDAGDDGSDNEIADVDSGHESESVGTSDDAEDVESDDEIDADSDFEPSGTSDDAEDGESDDKIIDTDFDYESLVRTSNNAEDRDSDEEIAVFDPDHRTVPVKVTSKYDAEGGKESNVKIPLNPDCERDLADTLVKDGLAEDTHLSRALSFSSIPAANTPLVEFNPIYEQNLGQDNPIVDYSGPFLDITSFERQLLPPILSLTGEEATAATSKQYAVHSSSKLSSYFSLT